MKMKIKNIDLGLCSSTPLCGAEYLLLDFRLSLG